MGSWFSVGVMEMAMEHGALGDFSRTYRAAWLEHEKGSGEQAEYLFSRARALAEEAVRSGTSGERLLGTMRRCVTELEDEHGLPIQHGFR